MSQPWTRSADFKKLIGVGSITVLPLTALAEVLQGFPVAFQVFVNSVALVVVLQTLQHV